MIILSELRDHFADAFFPRRSEWFLACLLVALGYHYTRNPELMTSSVSGAYKIMLQIFRQETWAVLMWGGGAARLIVLAINGAWWRTPMLRTAASFLSTYFWWQLTVSFKESFGTAYILSISLVVLELFNIMSAARDARIVTQRIKATQNDGRIAG